MNRYIRNVASGIVILALIFFALNIDVTTRQGINYKWHTIKMPLYLKILDFFDRHYNYMQLTKNIISGAKTDEEKAKRIFDWTCLNISKVPEGYPIIDDHVWHIIVRGYGVDDQMSDVFTTLCNYAKLSAFFLMVDNSDRTAKTTLSFVRLNGRWYVFDPSKKVYFTDAKGDLLDLSAIKNGKYFFINGKIEQAAYYKQFFCNISDIRSVDLRRSNIQSPLNRLLYELKMRFIGNSK